MIVFVCVNMSDILQFSSATGISTAVSVKNSHDFRLGGSPEWRTRLLMDPHFGEYNCHFSFWLRYVKFGVILKFNASGG